MSKELEALERIKSMVLFGGEIRLPYYTLNDTEYAKKVIEYKKEKLDIIENALKEWEIWKDALETGDYECPEKKALEIIKNHYKPNFADNDYLMTIGGAIFNLTKEEYDLLKEILL